MANYTSLKATIDANIKANGRQEITGTILNAVLKAAVDTIGDGYRFVGVVTPTSVAPISDNCIFVFASTAGTYTNFNLSVASGELCVFYFDTIWHKAVIFTGGGAGDAYTKAETNALLAVKQNASDNSLQTSDKTIVGAINENKGDIDDIEAVIPSQASSQNQVADKAFVNSSINAMAAFYITADALGNAFATKAALLAGPYYNQGQIRVMTRNDYALVIADETHSNASVRYVFDGTNWAYQYKVNDTPLTAAQLAALNSGITQIKTELIPTLAEWTAWNGKYTKPANGIPETDLTDAVQGKLNNAKIVVKGATSYSDCLADLHAGKILVFYYNGREYFASKYDNDVSIIRFISLLDASAKFYVCNLSQSTGWGEPAEKVVEQTGNKVTTLSASSTNAQYPSAKAVYDYHDTSKADKIGVSTALPADGALLANTFYDIATLSGEMTLSCAAAVGYAEYMLKFSTGGTAPTITWSGITWASGSAPTIAANKTYEVNILDGVAIFVEY